MSFDSDPSHPTDESPDSPPASVPVPPVGETAAPTATKKSRGRRARTHLVRKHPTGKKSRTTGVQAPIVQPHPVNGQLTEQEAAFVQDVTHPASKHFLQPEAAHQAAYPADPKSHTPSRVERTISKPPVAQTLKQLLDTPETRQKVQRGLDTILDDVDHAVYRPKEWLEASRVWADLTGNKAPDKIVAIPVGQEQRQQRYDEILEKIKRTERSEGEGTSDDSARETVLLPPTTR